MRKRFKLWRIVIISVGSILLLGAISFFLSSIRNTKEEKKHEDVKIRDYLIEHNFNYDEEEDEEDWEEEDKIDKEFRKNYDYSYKEDLSEPVTAKKVNEIRIPTLTKQKKRKISVSKIEKRSEILEFHESDNNLYVFLEDKDEDIILWRIPISQGKIIYSKKEKIDNYGYNFSSCIYVTDEYVIYCDNFGNVNKHLVNERIRVSLTKNENHDVFWSPVKTMSGDVLMTGKEFYAKKEQYEKEAVFYKVNRDTFEKTKLEKGIVDIFEDSDGEIVYLIREKEMNYAYYPETEKKYKIGENLWKDCNTKDGKKAFDIEKDYDDWYSGYEYYNRDMVCWLQKNNPWNYQEQGGSYYCKNLFVYKGRMYVVAKVEWMDSKEVEQDEDGEYWGTEASMIFSYDLKNYVGIREETQMNKVMQKFSKKTFDWLEDTSEYGYVETGELAFQIENVLVFRYLREDSDDYSYVYYDMETGEYKKSKENL